MAQSADQIVAKYRKWYEILAPSQVSVRKASELWDIWEQDDFKRPNVSEISIDAPSMEEGFFNELSEIASSIAGENLSTHYCPFRTSQYNFSAFTASDGYIVLVDEAFFQFLFILSVVLFHDAFGEIEPQVLADIKAEIKDILLVCYFGRQGYSFDSSTAFHRLMAASYELTEMANYFFQAMKAFILGHELGHHALGHTKGELVQKFAVGDREVDISVDKREWNDEYHADKFGYEVYLKAASSNPAGQHTTFLYRMDFAPIFFFEVCMLLEKMNHGVNDKAISPELSSHPPLELRKERLTRHFNPIKNGDDTLMYEELISSLRRLLLVP